MCNTLLQFMQRGKFMLNIYYGYPVIAELLQKVLKEKSCGNHKEQNILYCWTFSDGGRTNQQTNTEITIFSDHETPYQPIIYTDVTAAFFYSNEPVANLCIYFF